VHAQRSSSRGDCFEPFRTGRWRAGCVRAGGVCQGCAQQIGELETPEAVKQGVPGHQQANEPP
jgi:hypothetical protein